MSSSAPSHTDTDTRTVGSSTVRVSQLASAVADGALVVDIRSRAQREHQGVLPGALAVDAREATELLDPGAPAPLAAVRRAGTILLVSDDGLDAELFTWELHRRGVRSARAVEGGFAAISAARGLRLLAEAEHVRRERAAIAAH